MNSNPLQTASAYYDANPTTRWLRWGLGLSERLWPALAVRGAVRLFGTPLPPKWMHGHQPALAEWQQTSWAFEDASITLVDPHHPPSSPQTLRGRDEISAYFRDICGRNVEHQVRDAVSTPSGLAYTQHCRYPDGARVTCSAVAAVDRGRISRQTIVQVWD